MKRSLIILLIAVAGFAACTKDKETEAEQTQHEVEMKKVDTMLQDADAKSKHFLDSMQKLMQQSE
ncbi:MAG: hypothetical protein H6607_08100 [Flavobacteriales bacterium]|nr:hypothetical protein [Flavobacteriales bacterium]